MSKNFTENVLDLDYKSEVNSICESLKRILINKLKRRGFVVAISGGIDSSVSVALAVKALGKDRVLGLLLPEQDSSDKSSDRGQILAEHLGIEYIKQDIRKPLEAIGCYEWRDQAIKRTFPEYGEGWKNKIVISGGVEGKFNSFKLVVQDTSGQMFEKRLQIKEYLEIVAATNYKQRIRKTIEYFHADRLNYAVVGTPNRLEYDQGFFVKNGDGAADVKPIAHLYKTQVYAMAKYLGLPDVICNATPTTDTYSLPQGQDEFYFALPYQQMDIALWALNNNKSAEDLSKMLHIDMKHAEYLYKDIESKRRATAMLHWNAILVEPVAEPYTTSYI